MSKHGLVSNETLFHKFAEDESFSTGKMSELTLVFVLLTLVYFLSSRSEREIILKDCIISGHNLPSVNDVNEIRKTNQENGFLSSQNAPQRCRGNGNILAIAKLVTRINGAMSY